MTEYILPQRPKTSAPSFCLACTILLPLSSFCDHHHLIVAYLPLLLADDELTICGGAIPADREPTIQRLPDELLGAISVV